MQRLAWRFIPVVGIASLFADMAYEGAQGVHRRLGASGTMVGFVANRGELAAYATRSISGTFADRTGRYRVDVWVGCFEAFAIFAIA